MTSAILMPLGQRTLQVMHEAQTQMALDASSSSLRPNWGRTPGGALAALVAHQQVLAGEFLDLGHEWVAEFTTRKISAHAKLPFKSEVS